MTRSVATILPSLVAAALFACTPPPRTHAPAKEEPLVFAADAPDASADDNAGAADRVVIPNPDSGTNFHGYWEVSQDEAERADSGVEAFLREARPELADVLRDYYGQIFGILDESGKKLIHLNFLCKRDTDQWAKMAASDPNMPAPIDWQHHVVIVHDGGPCYFHLDFDPESGEYSNLIVNGQA